METEERIENERRHMIGDSMISIERLEHYFKGSKRVSWSQPSKQASLWTVDILGEPSVCHALDGD